MEENKIAYSSTEPLIYQKKISIYIIMSKCSDSNEMGIRHLLVIDSKPRFCCAYNVLTR